jgi:hypothetical protein
VLWRSAIVAGGLPEVAGRSHRVLRAAMESPRIKDPRNKLIGTVESTRLAVVERWRCL